MRERAPGRPPLPPDRRRSVRITLGFTASEAILLQAAARAQGYVLPNGAPALRLYLLALVARFHPPLAGPPPTPDPLVKRLQRQLRALSNNLHQAGSRLNQAVKLWHGTRAAEPPSQLAPIVRDLPRALEAIASTYRALLARS